MFTIDYRSRTPIYRQIIDNVEKLAARGVLPPDSQLPSVRALAVELSINPNTIARAYSELESRGVIYSLAGRGSFISGNSAGLREQALQRLTRRLAVIAGDAEHIALSAEDFLALCREAWEVREAKGVESFD